MKSYDNELPGLFNGSAKAHWPVQTDFFLASSSLLAFLMRFNWNLSSTIQSYPHPRISQSQPSMLTPQGKGNEGRTNHPLGTTVLKTQITVDHEPFQYHGLGLTYDLSE